MLYIVALHNNNWSECEAANDLLNEDRKSHFEQAAQRYEAEKERITEQQVGCPFFFFLSLPISLIPVLYLGSNSKSKSVGARSPGPLFVSSPTLL